MTAVSGQRVMISRSSVTPSISGIRKSEMTRGTGPFSSSCNASTPEPASAQLKPSPSSSRTRTRRRRGSSSTTRQRIPENCGIVAPKYRSLAPGESRPYVPTMTRIAEHDLARRFATRAVHAGHLGDPLAGAVMTPIYQTSTYIQEGLGRHKGYEYARTRNPTREALERNVAALESGLHGFAFGSGLAALDAVMKLLSAGDHVVSGENVYGGSHRQMTHIWSRMGIAFTFVDGGDTRAVAAAVTPNTKLVYAETPTNPMMRLCDLAATGEIARKAKALFAVDNTFATPFFQQPLQFGADIVLHSTTKYLNGHSDMVGGMLVTTRDDVAERLGFIQNSSGAVPGPFDCWLALRGTKTLALRMRPHHAHARRIPERPGKHPRGARGEYPGLRLHSQPE